jgi:hypothetical protein
MSSKYILNVILETRCILYKTNDTYFANVSPFTIYSIKMTRRSFSGMNKCANEILCFNEAVIAISHRYKAHIKLRNKKSHTHTSD